MSQLPPHNVSDPEEVEVAQDLITKLVIRADVELSGFQQRVESRLQEQIEELRTENRILAVGVGIALLLGLVRWASCL